MGLISQQDKHLQLLMLMKYYIYKYTENICTLHYILSFTKSTRFTCSFSRAYSFPGWLFGGQKPFTKGDSASKPLGMEEKWEISEASCPQPFDLSCLSPLGSGQVQCNGPEPAPLCHRASSWQRKCVIPGAKNLLWMSGEQNEMTPGRMQRNTVDLHVTCRVRDWRADRQTQLGGGVGTYRHSEVSRLVSQTYCFWQKHD